MAKHEIVKVGGPVLSGTCKWFRGDIGFLRVDGRVEDLFFHKSALPKDKNGQTIEPVRDGGKVQFRIGRRLKDGVDAGECAAEIKVLDVFVREAKAA